MNWPESPLNVDVDVKTNSNLWTIYISNVKLTYKTELDRHYGLLELGEEAGVFKKVSTRYEMPDGTKVFGKSINENPDKYFTTEVLDKIDELTKRKFTYGEDEE